MSLARGAREWTIANLLVGETGSQASRGFSGDRQKATPAAVQRTQFFRRMPLEAREGKAL
jgi:hypothetical protein